MNIIKKSYSFILITTSIFLIFILHISANNIHETTNIETKQNYNAQVTVLNPGLGAYYNCWSHDEDSNFAYNEESIIAKLGQRLEGKLDIYFAIMDSLNVCDYYYLSYNGYKNDNEMVEVDNISNTSNHILLLFSPSYARYSTEKTYKEFHYAMDEFSELYKNTYNIMPKYNLIAHSRGGIINILYAIEHPYNISKIYSLGSPYNGVDIAKDKTLLEATGLIDVLDELAENEGVSSVLDDEANIEIRNNWNDMLKTYNPNIEYYSLAYATSIPLFYRFVESAKEETQNKAEYFKTMDLYNLKNLISFIDRNQAFIYYLYESFIAMLRLIDNVCHINLFDTLFGQWGYEYDGEVTYDEIKNILNDIKYDYKENKIVIFHDFLVDNKSALGMGFADGINFNGFNRYIKLLDDKNSAKVRAVNNEPEVGHNLEAYDEDTVNFIVSNLDFGTGVIHNIDYYTCFKNTEYYNLY